MILSGGASQDTWAGQQWHDLLIDPPWFHVDWHMLIACKCHESTHSQDIASVQIVVHEPLLKVPS